MPNEGVLRGLSLAMTIQNVASRGHVGGGVVRDGLIVYYDAINNTGDGHSESAESWYDLTGNGYHGRLRDTAWGSDALFFDGVHSCVDDGSHNYEMITLEAVVRFDSVISGHWNCVADNFQGGGYGLILDGYDSCISMVTYRIEQGWSSAKDAVPVEVGRNYYLTGIANRAKTALYIDGQLVAEKQESKNIRISPVWFSLGYNPDGTASGTDEMMHGIIRSFRLYNRSLDEEEINRNYRYDKVRYRL